mgnify:CR=1 FL=1
MNPLVDIAAGAVKGLVTAGIVAIADQAKAEAVILSELHKVLDPSLRADSLDAFAKRLAELNDSVPPPKDAA